MARKIVVIYEIGTEAVHTGSFNLHCFLFVKGDFAMTAYVSRKD